MPLYRGYPLFKKIIGPEESLLALYDGSCTLLVPSPIAAFVEHCTDFASFEDHARIYWARIDTPNKILLVNSAFQFLLSRNEKIAWQWPFFIGLLEQVLAVFSRTGFFIEKREFMSRGMQETTETAKITTVGFVTRDRVASLNRALASYIENAKNHGKKTEFAVFDDSDNRDALESLRTLKKTYAVPILYAGKQEKEQFVNDLTARGIPRDILDFCLFGMDGVTPSMGANRNAFLLHTVGELAFAADDDTLCQIIRAPSYKPGIRIGAPEGSVRETWCYPTLAAAMQDVSVEDLDLLGLHEEALVPDVRTFLNRRIARGIDDEIDAHPMDGKLMDAILTGRARVTLSLNGSVGDTGASDGLFLLYASGPSRQRLLESEENFRTAFESRQAIRIHGKLSIFPADEMISMFFALNHEQIVPPFFPIFRNEDILFGKLVQDCVKDSLVLHLPWGLVHQPEPRKHYSEATGPAGQTRPCDFISSVASQLFLADKSLSTEDRLSLLGRELKSLGSLPKAEFKQHLKRVNISVTARYLRGKEMLLAKYPDSPDYWKTFVQSLIANYRELLERPDEGIPPDMVRKWGLDGSVDVYQRLLKLYGDLLIWWPEIEQASIELKKTGRRLAREV